MDKKSLIIAIIAVLAIAGATIRLVSSGSDGSSKLNAKPFEYLGSVAGEETAKVLGNQGTVVVVVEVIEGMQNPANESQVKGFKAGLAKTKGVTLKEVKELKRDMSGDPRLWPEGRAAQVAGFGTGVGAVVLFGNFPQTLPPADLAALKGGSAKLVVVSSASPTVDALVAQGVIRTAIVTRVPPKPAIGDKDTPAQWFERTYTVLKAP
ncbi:MAG: hypothetical protein EBS05_16365 [Proteobacteria bacterium]|nr:hypothetical protein [Pseudomonadota bacterium]